MFLLPLIQQLDDSGLGPLVYRHHIPVVAYADDLLVMSGNTRDLQNMLDIVTNFSASWRIDFVSLDPSKTKSHSFIFGAGLLAQLPEWHLCGQTLSYREETEHLGVQLRSQLQGSDHVIERVRRGRGAFFGLTPAGMFNSQLPAADKAYLFRAVVTPTMLFGCSLCFLKSADIARLETWQATAVKSALRLPRTAHHSALLAALQVPSVQGVLRRALFSAFRDAFRGEHRLRSVLLSSLARVTLNETSTQITSLASHMLELCGGNLGTLLRVAGGHIDRELVHAPRPTCGVTDSIKWLLEQNHADAWDVLRLLVMPHVEHT